MRTRVRNIRLFATRFGWKAAAKLAVLWFLRRVVCYRRAIVYCLGTDSVRPPDSCAEVDWRYMDAIDLPATTLQAFGVNRAESLRFGEYTKVFVGTQQGLLCYVSLVSKEGFAVPDRIRVRFSGDTDAYVGDCVTAEPYRGTGLYPCALRHLAVRLRAEGRTHLYLFVESDNLASIRGVRKAGFRPVVSCSIYRCGSQTKRRWRLIGREAARYVGAWTVETLEMVASTTHTSAGRSEA